MEKREEIALQKTLATPTARLIDNPAASDDPIAPRKIIILFIGFIFGLVVPAAYIYVRRMLFPVFKDKSELQRMTNVPILGEVSRISNIDDVNSIVIGENNSSVAAELFRLLRSNISYTNNSAAKKIIAITSSVSGEGKTFVSVNLAMAYALTGKRTLVIGMDVRRPFLAYKFGLDNRKGVTTFLSGQVDDIGLLIQKSRFNDNLDILPAGPIPPNPNELLLSDNMQRMMKQLREEYDYIIIDTAPIGLISDAFLIVPYSDLQLYVVRASYSTKNGLRVLHQAVQDKQLANAYIVLNGVNVESSSYGYRKYGSYGQRRNTYYYTDKKS